MPRSFVATNVTDCVASNFNYSVEIELNDAFILRRQPRVLFYKFSVTSTGTRDWKKRAAIKVHL